MVPGSTQTSPISLRDFRRRPFSKLLKLFAWRGIRRIRPYGLFRIAKRKTIHKGAHDEISEVVTSSDRRGGGFLPRREFHIRTDGHGKSREPVRERGRSENFLPGKRTEGRSDDRAIAWLSEFVAHVSRLDSSSFGQIPRCRSR